MLAAPLKTAASLLLLGGLLYLALLLYVYLNQANLIHLPQLPGRQVTATPRMIGLDYERVELNTKDGLTLEGWFLPAAQARATLLFLHGNAGNISHRLDSLQLFNQLGLAVFIFDYRGYGNSQGEPTESGIYLDAQAAWAYLTQTRGIPDAEILLFGRSFGGAVAAYLAERHQGLGLALESTFTSIPDMAAEIYPWLPVRSLARYQYDTRSRMANIQMPVLVIHSPSDEIIPYSQGRELFELAGEPKQFLQINGDHNTGMLDSRSSYRKGWERFIQLCSAAKDGLSSAP